MKVRWREHEILFVTILVVAQIIVSLLRMYDPALERTVIDFAAQFNENGDSFIYWKNVLLPQVSSVTLIYLAWLSITLVIIPMIKKISFNDFEKIFSLNILKAILAIAITSYLLAIGVNVISYYAKPHLFNYSGYQFLSVCGYNDTPLTNLFFGFGRALGIIMLFASFASLREFIIWLIERPGRQREYRILITNNTTPLFFIYFLALIFINPVHKDFLLYVTCITPIFLLYIYTTFWLFPIKKQHSFLHIRTLLKLLLSTFICTIPFILNDAFREAGVLFFVYWAFLLLIVTPLSWSLYQQRKDKIIQLKGMENALAKSSAHLQFLRSQINPHFLFNALNTLYGTALREEAEHTAEAIQKLGDMMRFMLHENNLDFIPMDKEIEYLKNYIALQKLRTQSSADIFIEDNIDETKCSQAIAPMLLIPFVENAFKHGISLKEKSWIKIILHCDERNILFEVRNSMHPRTGNDTEKESSGIGLKNVTGRLKLLYPGKHGLSVHGDEHEFVVQLTIQVID